MTDTNKGGVRRGRSPSFPFINLKVAVTRLKELEAKFGRHPVPVTKAGLAWNMKEGSSQAYQTLAALKSFGFIDYSGIGPGRDATLTDDARTYLRAQQDEIKNGIIREAALKPKEIAKYWEVWLTDPPIEAVRLDQLILKANYTDEGAKTFLKVYDETIAYAGLTQSDKPDEDDSDNIFRVGDAVNWEIQGQIQWREPWKVVEVATHDDGEQYLKVEGSGSDAGQSGWIPMKQAIQQEAVSLEPTGGSRTFTPPPMHAIDDNMPSKGVRREVFALDEGDVVLIYPDQMSKDSYDDLEGYLKLFLKKARRRAGMSEPTLDEE